MSALWHRGLRIVPGATRDKVNITADEIILGPARHRFTGVSLTCDIGATPGANAIDVGVQAASTWYDLVLASKDDGTEIVSQFVIEGNTPKLPPLFNAWNAIFSCYNNSGSDLYRWHHDANIVYWDEATNVSPFRLVDGESDTVNQDCDPTPIIPATVFIVLIQVYIQRLTVGQLTGYVLPKGSNWTGLQEIATEEYSVNASYVEDAIGHRHMPLGVSRLLERRVNNAAVDQWIDVEGYCECRLN